MKNQVNFKYQLTGVAQAKCRLDIWDKHVDFELSNASNPISDLLNGISSLILEPSHIWGEENVAWIEWYGENTAYRWMISTPDGNHLHISITETVDIFDDSTTHSLLEGECTFDQFLIAIVTELDAFIKQVGLLNYIQKWQKDEFPISTLLFLKKQLIEKNIWKAKNETGDTLKLEIDILLQ